MTSSNAEDESKWIPSEAELSKNCSFVKKGDATILSDAILVEITDAEKEDPEYKELVVIFEELLKVHKTRTEDRIDAFEAMRHAFPVGVVDADYLANFVGAHRFFNLV